MHDSIQDLIDNGWKLVVEKDSLVMSKDRIKIERSKKGARFEIENGTFNNDIWFSEEETKAIGNIMSEEVDDSILYSVKENNILDDIHSYAKQFVYNIKIIIKDVTYKVCYYEVDIPFPPKNRLLTLYLSKKSGFKPVAVFDADGNITKCKKSYSISLDSLPAIQALSGYIAENYKLLKLNKI